MVEISFFFIVDLFISAYTLGSAYFRSGLRVLSPFIYTLSMIVLFFDLVRYIVHNLYW